MCILFVCALLKVVTYHDFFSVSDGFPKKMWMG